MSQNITSTAKYANEYLPGRKHAKAHLGELLILGLGKSTRGVLNYLSRCHGRFSGITVVSGGASQDDYDFLHALSLPQACSFHEYLGSETVTGTYDLCVVSPGIAPHSNLYQSALGASCELISELEFAWRESAAESRWIAITGTNGKSTTTALCAHILQSAGREAFAVGNIGQVCIELVSCDDSGIKDQNNRIYVAETSSYQLYSTSNFAPDVAILLGITPDHLSWHQGYEGYKRAKMKIFSHLFECRHCLAAFDATNEEAFALMKNLYESAPVDVRDSFVPIGCPKAISISEEKAALVQMPFSNKGCYLDSEGWLTVRYAGEIHRIMSADELPILGEHNILNALCSACAAFSMGLSERELYLGLKSFRALEHRIEACGEVGTVKFYNDSKATNVDATLKALSAFPDKKAIVLLGGDDKGTDLGELVACAVKHLRAVVLFGASRKRFSEAFESACVTDLDGFEVLHARHLRDAFELACQIAQPGEVIALSPACASFDEFKNFEERGRFFKQLVQEYAGMKRSQAPLPEEATC